MAIAVHIVLRPSYRLYCGRRTSS